MGYSDQVDKSLDGKLNKVKLVFDIKVFRQNFQKFSQVNLCFSAFETNFELYDFQKYATCICIFDTLSYIAYLSKIVFS